MAKEKGFGKWMKGKKDFWTDETRQKLSNSLKKYHREKEPVDRSLWVGSQKDYREIHYWLARKFGKASHCEFCGTEKGRIEWAKLKHKKYERKRNNFWQLCRTCHIRYDRCGGLK